MCGNQSVEYSWEFRESGSLEKEELHEVLKEAAYSQNMCLRGLLQYSSVGLSVGAQSPPLVQILIFNLKIILKILNL